MIKHPLLLLVLDGFGIRENNDANAVNNADAPTWHKLWAQSDKILLNASAEAVGLPAGQIGNSEVGHLAIGSGRIVYQDLSRIDHAIADGSFAQNLVFRAGIETAKSHQSAVHLMGLLSPGGVHSHENHFYAMLALCKAMDIKNVYIHAFLDGRDVPPQSAMPSLQCLEAECKKLAIGQIASVIGRYYAMDRDQRWERIEKAYQLLTESIAPFHANSAEEALQLAYQRGETDEFVQATIIGEAHPIVNNDVIFFMNFRSDRARQISRAFLQKDFSGFPRAKQPNLAAFISLTEYAKDIPSQIAFPNILPSNTLGECFAKNNLSQLRIAETEKYAHVTFFFNGGREEPFTNEQRILIPSPKIATYDLQPAMSVEAITEQLLQAINERKYDVIICNFANPDMIGHTGDYQATLAAIHAIDNCLAKLLPAIHTTDSQMIITADHGNAECMYDEQHHQPHTAHTMEPVPFVYVGQAVRVLQQTGSLADIAPTVLTLLGLPIPAEMTGKVLVEPLVV